MKSYAVVCLVALLACGRELRACESLVNPQALGPANLFSLEASNADTKLRIVERSAYAQALEFLHSQGCSQVMVEASFVPKPRSFRRKLVLVKLVGVNGAQSFVASFAFDTLKYFSDSLLAEIYNADTTKRELFTDTATVNLHTSLVIRKHAHFPTTSLDDVMRPPLDVRTPETLK